MFNNPYEELSKYELTYLISHLEECGLFLDIHNILGREENNSWFEIKTQNELFESYVQDIRSALSLAFKSTDKEKHLELIFKYGLILSSITSTMSDLIDPKFAAVLVKNNTWSLERVKVIFNNRGDFYNVLINILEDISSLSRSDLAVQIIRMIPKIEDEVERLSIINKLPNSLAGSSEHELKHKLIRNLEERSRTREFLETLNSESASTLLDAITGIDERMRERILINILVEIMKDMKSNKHNGLVLIPNIKDTSIYSEFIKKYTQTVRDHDVPHERIKDLTALLNIIRNKSEIRQIYKYIMADLDYVDIENGGRAVNMDFFTHLEPKYFPKILQFLLEKINSQFRKADLLYYFVSRVVDAGSEGYVAELMHVIEGKLDDDCCNAATMLGFGRHLTTGQINTIIEQILMYPTKVNLNLKEHRDYFNLAFKRALMFVDGETLKKFLNIINEKNIRITWWGFEIEELDGLIPDTVFKFFCEAHDKIDDFDILSLLELMDFVSSPDLRKKGFEVIFRGINQIDDDFRKKSYFSQAFVLADKYNYINDDIMGPQILDFEQVTLSIVRLMRSNNNVNFTEQIRKLVSKAESKANNYSKSKSLVHLASYLRQNNINYYFEDVFLKVMRDVNNLSPYYQIKTLLRLIAVVEIEQKREFFDVIFDRVVALEKIQNPIYKYFSIDGIRESDIYTDMAYMAAQFGEFEFSFALSQHIISPPQKGVLLSKINNPPVEFSLKLFNFAVEIFELYLEKLHSPGQIELVVDYLYDLLFMLPNLPAGCHKKIFTYLERIPDNYLYEVLMALIPYANIEELKRVETHYIKKLNEHQKSGIRSNLISRYAKIGEFSIAKNMFNEYGKIETTSIRNAIDLLKIENDPVIEKYLTDAFLDLIDRTLLPISKEIFLKYANLSLEVIEEVSKLILSSSYDFKGYRYKSYSVFSPAMMAVKLFENELSEDEKISIIEECLEYLNNLSVFSSNARGIDSIELLGINDNFDFLYYGRAKFIELLLPEMARLSEPSRYAILEKYINGFVHQQRSSILVELTVFYEIFPSSKNSADLIKYIYQVSSWWA